VRNVERKTQFICSRRQIKLAFPQPPADWSSP
jgi:hypothetical protein